jgi:hypothetical protein
MLDGLQDGTIGINEAKVFFRRCYTYLRNCYFQFTSFKVMCQEGSNGVASVLNEVKCDI